MSQKIHHGSILEKRYQIDRALGRGGFGQAYLAINLNRYNEPCVLKEFAPDIEPQYWKKAKELFERECSQLYRLNHDQIPRFREILKTKFDRELYVFLVQDYVRGLDYHTIIQKYGLLNEGQAICFLQQILPVLSYIHNNNLIHRDISPDNIICRISDQKPVLIDFGLVKEVSTKYTQIATPAGKPGFAPPEQMSGHAVSPSCDLYALGATVLYLLTGRYSADFYTHRSGEWNLDGINISIGLKQILIKMLSHRPIDRYQTVAEVSRAIAVLTTMVAVRIPIDPKDLDDISVSPPKRNHSFTSSILQMFHKADRWARIKSDFAKPLQYVGGGTLALLLLILTLNWAIKGIGGVFAGGSPSPQPISTPTPTVATATNSCTNIGDRLKDAKKSTQDVDKAFYRKYPGHKNKQLNPKNDTDRQLIDEWCQIAEQLAKQ
jgi:serine/threonine protein kinase, bacterial